MSKREKLAQHLENLPDTPKELLDGITLAQEYTAILRAEEIVLDSESQKLTRYGMELKQANPNVSEIKVKLANLYADLLLKKPGMTKSSIQGGIAVMIFLALSTGVLFSLAYTYRTSFDTEILTIPLYVYVWGVMGTLAYLIWACVTHIAYKDFDNYYIPWYVFRVPLGGMMAAIIYLVFFAGMSTLNLPEGTEITEDSQYPFWVLAFLSGFSIRYSMNTLDRVTRSLMPNTQDKKGNKPTTEVT